jgi:hypothetical protein
MLSPHCNRWEKEKIAAFLANPGPLHDQPMREVVAWLPQDAASPGPPTPT